MLMPKRCRRDLLPRPGGVTTNTTDAGWDGLFIVDGEAPVPQVELCPSRGTG